MAVEGQFRDIPLPLYVSEAIDKHIASHGTTDDGYLFRGRRHKHVTRRTYNEDFERAASKAGLPPEFIPHTLRHCFTSISLAHGIPITEVSRWLGHNSIEVTHQIYVNSRECISWERNHRSTGRRIAGAAFRSCRYRPRDLGRFSDDPLWCMIRPSEGRGRRREVKSASTRGTGFQWLGATPQAGHSNSSNTRLCR